ncbi:hypothetical protein [Arthrobacter sp. zg-Y238]|nr:hypothetical protein [Arthrobacter sp. zg-Y238]MCQ1954387.1 hypothetical protein [Arthrobacter sp. zg-Y238]
MSTVEPRREWRRKRPRRTGAEWAKYAGVAVLALVTVAVVVFALGW